MHLKGDVKTFNLTTWNLRRLTNPDGVSCYANAIVQSTFHCPILRQSLIDSVETSELKKMFNQYICNVGINIRALRRFAGNNFVRTEQQCPAEFFEALCEKSDALENSVRIEQIMTTKCSRSECNSVRPVDPNNRRIFKLTFPMKSNEITYERLMNPTRIVGYDIQSLIDYSLSPIGNEQLCEKCGTEITDTFEIRVNENVLILQLEIFFNVLVNYERMAIKYTGFNLKNPINDTLSIAGEKFKISSIIFHEGGIGTINSGHCINLLRYNDGWVRTSDTQIIKIDSWSTNEGQPYLFFLEKVIEYTIPNNKSVDNAVFNPYYTSASVAMAPKRKIDKFLSTPLLNGSKKARIGGNNDVTSHDERNMSKPLETRTNKSPSYKNSGPTESSQDHLSTPSSVESGEKIVFFFTIYSAKKNSPSKRRVLLREPSQYIE